MHLHFSSRLSVRDIFIEVQRHSFGTQNVTTTSISIARKGVYGWDALARSHWLKDCSIHYWGDIDTHGFGILDQLRGYFGHVDSFLMDRATLDAHAAVWGGREQAPVGGLAQADARRASPLRRSARQPHPRGTAAGAGVSTG